MRAGPSVDPGQRDRRGAGQHRVFLQAVGREQVAILRLEGERNEALRVVGSVNDNSASKQLVVIIVIGCTDCERLMMDFVAIRRRRGGGGGR